MNPHPPHPTPNPPPHAARFLRPARARPGIYRFDAAAILDAAGLALAPGSMLIEIAGPGPGGAPPDDLPGPASFPLAGRFTILAVDTPPRVDAHPASLRAHRIPLPTSILIPPFINTHTHLDLTHIGPRPHDPAAGFIGFVELVRASRACSEEEITASVLRGAELSLRAGVVAVGDIAGAPRGEPQFSPARALASTPLGGVSFIEFFGIGKGEARGFERLDQITSEAGRAGPGGRIRLGLQPHATNTVSPRLYARAGRVASELGLPICTHLAETPEERAFIAEAGGPQRELLERLGIWDDSMLADIGLGRSPIAHLAEILPMAKWLAVHINDCGDADLEILARSRVSVAYCPRASAYFGAERTFGPHRYRDLIRAGVPVALGTDSIINLPAGADAPGGPGLSVLEEMRFLHARDGVDPLILLAMGTINAARALNMDERAFAFGPGASPAGLVAVDIADGPASAAGLVTNKGNPLLLLVRNRSCPTRIRGEVPDRNRLASDPPLNDSEEQPR
ncbi:MAG: amidohydrolase family protein [Phycisphaerales bacterium]|nr:amidohydrolase family protein [Phycisphaerales bacterium]